MKGFFVNKGEQYYTDLRKVFFGIPELFLKYNWLLTDVETNHDRWRMGLSGSDSGDSYYILPGSVLFDILKMDNVQWIWGVFSGIPTEIAVADIRLDHLPYADGNSTLWKEERGIQHPQAEIEIVAWDSSATLFVGKDAVLIDRIKQLYPYV